MRFKSLKFCVSDYDREQGNSGNFFGKGTPLNSMASKECRGGDFLAG
jgi:hypothetical protein